MLKRLVIVSAALAVLLGFAAPCLAGAEDLVDQGTRLLLANDNKGAIKVLSQAIDSGQLGPHSKHLYVALLNRGMAYEKRLDTAGALADYNRAISVDPKRPQAYSNRGNIWLRRRQPRMAIADYDKAIQLDPVYVGAYLRRANAWRVLGDKDRAMQDYSTAKGLDPKVQIPKF
ncbi:MAG: tetratricopeptide repeat protein [Desulfovibrionaceae bacterium]|nr:tetratricopeptide repeat protein [Desulfovibrionaceae bacterium]MDD4952433.1 tetratricopeptide repeat protein [Desulfovibrionaceae bacterium]